jgi:hypothetical protein
MQSLEEMADEIEPKLFRDQKNFVYTSIKKWILLPCLKKS